MALAFPLAILSEAGSNESIARYTDGNVTPPKSLNTLGATEGQALPRKISCWVGCVAGSTASLTTFASSGSDFSNCSFKCTRIVYSPALGGTQTWRTCICWCAETVNDGEYGDAYACVRLVCNLSTVCSCSVTSLGGGSPKFCNGTWFRNIDSNDDVCLLVCAKGDNGGSGYGYAYACQCMYCSTLNVNGTVILGTPRNVGAWAEDA